MKVDALIMAGGKGERMRSDVEKSLLRIGNFTMLEKVIFALEGAKYVVGIWAATSENAPETETFLKERSIAILRTPGRGYVEDVVYALKELGLGKTLVISADLALISSEDIDYAIEEYNKSGCAAMKVVVPLDVFEEVGVEPELEIEGLAPSGINVVDGKNLEGEEFELVTRRVAFAVNVNTAQDVEISKLYIGKDGKTEEKEE